MITLSVSIIAHNEAKQLKDCLDSLKGIADEIVVIDCESNDNTKEVAYQYTNNVYSRRNLMNLNVNKQFGIDQCTKDWVLYLDPDEKLSDDLRQNLKKILQLSENKDVCGFSLSRKNYFLGCWLRYGSQYPDRQLRIFRNKKGIFPQRHVHEKIEVDGKVEKIILGDIVHNPYPDVAAMLEKLDFYTSFQSRFLKKSGKNLKVMPVIAKAAFRFFKRYFLKFGFLDGYRGFIACWYDFATAVITDIKYRLE